MIGRRAIITAALAAIASPASTQTALAQAAMSRITAYAFSFPALAGGDIRLADYAGRPLLVVNTASLCGFTPQYAGLQELWTQFHDRGLMIIGVPSNDFGGQEPGGATEIAETAQHHYGVTFPIAAKAGVKGAKAHPFYKWAADATEGCSAVELSQVSDRPRRLHRRGIFRDRRTIRYAYQNRHCAGTRGLLMRRALRELT
jgi:glutathione peroxidase